MKDSDKAIARATLPAATAIFMIPLDRASIKAQGTFLFIGPNIVHLPALIEVRRRI